MPPLTEHIVMRNRDIEHFDDIEVYLKHGGYESMRVALKEKGVAAQNMEILQRAADAFDKAGQVFHELHLENNAQIVEGQRSQVLKLLAKTGG